MNFTFRIFNLSMIFFCINSHPWSPVGLLIFLASGKNFSPYFFNQLYNVCTKYTLKVLLIATFNYLTFMFSLEKYGQKFSSTKISQTFGFYDYFVISVKWWFNERSVRKNICRFFNTSERWSDRKISEIKKKEKQGDLNANGIKANDILVRNHATGELKDCDSARRYS